MKWKGSELNITKGETKGNPPPLPPLPPSASLPSSSPPPWPRGEGGKLGEGLWRRNRIKLQKNLGRKIISGLDLFCQHVVIVHFDFGQKWNLKQQGWWGLGEGGWVVGGCGEGGLQGGGVASHESSAHQVWGLFTTSKYTFTTKANHAVAWVASSRAPPCDYAANSL